MSKAIIKMHIGWESRLCGHSPHRKKQSSRPQNCRLRWEKQNETSWKNQIRIILPIYIECRLIRGFCDRFDIIFDFFLTSLRSPRPSTVERVGAVWRARISLPLARRCGLPSRIIFDSILPRNQPHKSGIFKCESFVPERFGAWEGGDRSRLSPEMTPSLVDHNLCCYVCEIYMILAFNVAQSHPRLFDGKTNRKGSRETCLPRNKNLL